MAEVNYQGYENNEGDCKEGVEGICGHLTVDGSFSDTTQPTSSDVDRMLTESYYHVAVRLAAAGYDPTQSDARVIGFLQRVQILDAVLQVEMANPITGPGEPNERFLALKAERDDMFALIASGGLDLLGATVVRLDPVLTGISKDRKLSVESDSDLVQKRFRRGLLQDKGRGDPAAEADTYSVDT